ncbi:UNVERIFIED_CONTAM: hypothetical protein K2H54_039850 [Gekko kuhli]
MWKMYISTFYSNPWFIFFLLECLMQKVLFIHLSSPYSPHPILDTSNLLRKYHISINVNSDTCSNVVEKKQAFHQHFPHFKLQKGKGHWITGIPHTCASPPHIPFETHFSE